MSQELPTTQKAYRCPECHRKGFRSPGLDICVSCAAINFGVKCGRESAVTAAIHKQDWGGRSQAVYGLFSGSVQVG